MSSLRSHTEKIGLKLNVSQTNSQRRHRPINSSEGQTKDLLVFVYTISHLCFRPLSYTNPILPLLEKGFSLLNLAMNLIIAPFLAILGLSDHCATVQRNRHAICQKDE